MTRTDWQEIVERVTRVSRGGSDPEVRPLDADASNRNYFRVEVVGGGTVMVMRLAEDPLKSEEVVDGERPDTLPFIDVGTFLGRGGVPVPKVLHIDMDAGVIVLEDLGDTTIERALAAGADKRGLYVEAVGLMVRMQAWADREPDPSCIAFRRRFGHGLLRWELDHFHEWCLTEWTGRAPTKAETGELFAFYDVLVERLTSLPAGFVHRDFQSRNLMVTDGRLRVIDFQDALQGPYLYDLAALLRDSYVSFDEAEVEDLHRVFIDARQGHGLWAPGADELMEAFHMQALQRKLKDAGRFVYIDRVKHNPKFLANIPQSLAYAREALDHLPEYCSVREILAKYLPDHLGKK